MSWFLPSGMLKFEESDTEPRENSPLCHITWLLRNKLFREQDIIDVIHMHNFNSIRDEVSHDNMTAIYTYLTIALETDKIELNALKVWAAETIDLLKIWPDYKHPRDMLYIAMLQDRWVWWLLFPVWYVALMIIFLWMGFDKYKTRKHGTFYKTDTEILYWIRLQLPKRFFVIHATRPFILPLMWWKYGRNWFQKTMELYYGAPDHPNKRDIQ